MRRKWLGDNHDMRKYCLLKLLSDTIHANIAVNWMLTDDEQDARLNINNNHNDYCDNLSNGYEDYLKLMNAVLGFKGSVDDMDTILNNNGLLHFSYKGENLKKNREVWLNRFLDNINDNSLLFFDPNTGIETPSTQKADYENYLLFNEIVKSFTNEKVVGLLVYQHALRSGSKGKKKSEEQIQAIKDKLDRLKELFIQMPPTMVFAGGKNSNECFGEAYILLLKDKTNMTNIQKMVKAMFCESFLSIVM